MTLPRAHSSRRRPDIPDQRGRILACRYEPVAGGRKVQGGDAARMTVKLTPLAIGGDLPEANRLIAFSRPPAVPGRRRQGLAIRRKSDRRHRPPMACELTDDVPRGGIDQHEVVPDG